MEKGICFLDIDGVVNTKDIKYKNGEFYTFYHQWHEKKVNNKLALLWLSKLCIEQNLDIVSISNWSNFLDSDAIKQTLYNSGLVTDVNIKDVLRGFRYKIILDYILKNNINRFVILDDVLANYSLNDDSEKLKDNLVLCDKDYGFVGDKKYNEAVKILSKKISV